MKKFMFVIGVIVVVGLIFFGGLILGIQHNFKNAALSSSSLGDDISKASTTLVVLRDLEAGKIDEAKAFLDLQLDGAIIGINAVLPHCPDDNNTRAARRLLAAIAEYRAKCLSRSDDEPGKVVQKNDGCAIHDDLHLVSITGVPLADGQRIAGVALAVSGGIVHAVHNVPPDWSVTVNGPRSGVSSIEAVAGHGVSYHTDCRAFARFITVHQAWSNLTITGTATLSTRDAESIYSLSANNIKVE
jgi:hypothetical protein